jgi:hypothetical protein
MEMICKSHGEKQGNYCNDCGKKLFRELICECGKTFLTSREETISCSRKCATKRFDEMNKEKRNKYKLDWKKDKDKRDKENQKHA